MKKTLFSLLFLFAGILCGQQVQAQDATLIYTSDFTQFSFNGWTPEGDYADEGLWDVSIGALVADASMATDKCDSRLVSPFIKLGTDNNTVSFSYRGFNFYNIRKEAGLLIREEGGEWVSIKMKYPGKDDYSVFNTGEMEVPSEFSGKNVQFAYSYKLMSTESIGLWIIQDFNVRGFGGEAPKEKAEAGISYDVEEVTYTIGDPDFKAPVLNNPNNLKAYYSSENESVAIVEEDGSLTIVGPGTALIRALTLETDEFKKGSASYTLTVVDPSIVYTANFDTGKCGFREESVETENDAWSRFWEGCMMANAFAKVKEMTVFYLVSPNITLDESGNTVSFDHKGSYFEDWEGQAQLHVREVGGEWVKLEGINYPYDTDTYVNSGDLVIPSEFNGKTVQIGFMYAADGTAASGIWYVDNLIVKRAEAPAKKADPELSFPEETYEYVFGPEKFKAPVLSNPYGVEVSYSSDNFDVADADFYTGEIYVYNYGTAVITASSEETEKFNAGSASYTLIVTDIPTGIDGVSADKFENGKVYDLQGRRVNKLAKGVYVVNGKKVIIR